MGEWAFTPAQNKARLEYRMASARCEAFCTGVGELLKRAEDEEEFGHVKAMLAEVELAFAQQSKAQAAYVEAMKRKPRKKRANSHAKGAK